MNDQVIRILELAEKGAVIGVEQRYHTYGPKPTLEQYDEEALNYCINLKELVVYVHEEFPWGTVTRLALTPDGEMALYEHRHAEPVPKHSAIPTRPTVIMPSVDDSKWPTQAKVMRGLGLHIEGSNTGQMQVSRLCSDGTLRTNGKTGRACRVEPASILEYTEREGIAWNDT